ncbi:hypothetical protein [Streptomyces sp. NBC_01296]|nr:hypothetical protein OG299_40060 [Streptomyces sp. NBC_01296]
MPQLTSVRPLLPAAKPDQAPDPPAAYHTPGEPSPRVGNAAGAKALSR